MSLMLTDIKNSRDNNFNLLRFLAASLVLFGHSYALSKSNIAQEWLFGHVAVDIFFIISGYLVTASLFTRKSLWIFTKNRFLRIVPGLFVAMLFNVFIIGVLYTDIPIGEYLFSSRNLSLHLCQYYIVTRPHSNEPTRSLYK